MLSTVITVKLGKPAVIKINNILLFVNSGLIPRELEFYCPLDKSIEIIIIIGINYLGDLLVLDSNFKIPGIVLKLNSKKQI